MNKLGASCFSFRTPLLLLAAMLLISFPLFAQEDVEAAEETVTEEAPAPDLGGDPDAGKALFNSLCASCHHLDNKTTGPPLRHVADKHDREWLGKWIRNSQEVIKSGDATAVALFEEFNGSVMQPFPQLSDEDIDNILAYTSQPKAEPTVATDGGVGPPGGTSDGISSNLVLSLLVLVLALLVITLFVVNKTLRRFIQDKGAAVPEKPRGKSLWQSYKQNQFLLLVTAIAVLLGIAWFGYSYLMQVGVDEGYAPVQPIHFSHKIHAGDNQIDCQLCHASARKSKTSGIPPLNVCMNCHETIFEYNGDLDPDEGLTKEFYDGEIAKLYEAAGWDPAEHAYTKDPSPVKWIRIHDLPDFAFFSHAQHVTVAGVDCNKCHGPVEEMEVLNQYAPLTMGWCVDCHRETNVDVANNEYYEKIHAELSKKYGVEKLTIAEMGGLECGKCHY